MRRKIEENRNHSLEQLRRQVDQEKEQTREGLIASKQRAILRNLAVKNKMRDISLELKLKARKAEEIRLNRIHAQKNQGESSFSESRLAKLRGRQEIRQSRNSEFVREWIENNQHME